jgi:hypothetical protein
VAGPRFRLADGRTFTLRGALLVTAASALLPGLAHLRSGRRAAGIALFAGYAALAGALVPTGILPIGLTPALPLSGRQALAGFGPAVAAAAWVTLLLLSYRAVRPGDAPLPARAAAGAVVALLCALVVAPAFVLPRHGEHVVARAPAAAPSAAPSVRPPSRHKARRLNLLLVPSGKGAPSLASVDPRTGDTVLLALPGGVRHLRGLPAALRLDAVYAYGAAHPRLAGRHARDPGAALLKRAVGRAVGLPVDRYRLVGAREMRRITRAARRCGAARGVPGHGRVVRVRLGRRSLRTAAARAVGAGDTCR